MPDEIKSPESMTATVDYIICHRCDREQDRTGKFCRECGQSLWRKCPQCNDSISVSEKFCGSCGLNVAEQAKQNHLRLSSAMQSARSLYDDREYGLAIKALSEITKSVADTEFADEHDSLLRETRIRFGESRKTADRLFEEAQQQFSNAEYSNAKNSLEKIAPAFLTAQMEKLLAEVRVKDDRIQKLNSRIEEAFSGKATLDHLKYADQLLELVPAHEKALELSKKLTAHALKIAINKYEQSALQDANAVLLRIPERFRSETCHQVRNEIFNHRWMELNLTSATHVDQTLVNCVEMIKRKFPDHELANQIAPELFERFQKSGTGLLKMKKWAKGSTENLGIPVRYLNLENDLKDFQKVLPLGVPYAATLMTATGLAIGGLKQADYGFGVVPEGRKKFSLSRSGLNPKKTSAVGVDVGYSGIRAVVVTWSEENRPRIEAIHEVKFGKRFWPSVGQQQQHDEIVAALKKLKQKVDFSRHNVVANMPNFQSFVRVCSVPPADKKEIDQIVKFEVKHQIPIPVEEIDCGYQLSQEKPPSLFLFASKKAHVSEVMRSFNEADVPVSLLQAEPIALLNLWQACQSSQSLNGSTIALLNIGHQSTSLVVTGAGRIWTRIINLGSNVFTAALAKELKLDSDQANSLKENPGKANQIGHAFEIMQPGFEMFDTQIRRSLEAVQRSDPDLKPAAMFCTGGGSLLHGMIRMLTSGPDRMLP